MTITCCLPFDNWKHVFPIRSRFLASPCLQGTRTYGKNVKINHLPWQGKTLNKELDLGFFIFARFFKPDSGNITFENFTWLLSTKSVITQERLEILSRFIPFSKSALDFQSIEHPTSFSRQLFRKLWAFEFYFVFLGGSKSCRLWHASIY